MSKRALIIVIGFFIVAVQFVSCERELELDIGPKPESVYTPELREIH